MTRDDLTVLCASSAGTARGNNNSAKADNVPVTTISDRDRSTALAFLARILEEMRGIHKNCSIQGKDSVITYDEACGAYKELLLEKYPCA